jgi:hypothetical protein
MSFSEQRDRSLSSVKTRYVVGRPRKAAKANVPPNSLIVTGSAVGARALRASRSCHERR